MPNVAQLLKEEISRLAKKEIRAGIAGIRSDSIRLKKSNADLKRRIGSDADTPHRVKYRSLTT